MSALSKAGVAVWGASRFGPVADGTYYHEHARRLALGLGYSWGDGAGAAVNHYPVGYPALVSVAYRAGGAHPGTAMAMAVLIGTLGALAFHLGIVAYAKRRGRPTLAAHLSAIFFSLAPGLLFYTPALMTEGLSAWMLGGVLGLVLLGPARPWVMLTTGAIFGGLVLVRPQFALFLPALWVLVIREARPGRLGGVVPAIAFTLGAVLALLPWWLRTLHVYGEFALVSMNDGWNLLIGTDDSAHGTWAELRVPSECASVFEEAAKNRCYWDAAVARIEGDPFGFVMRVPMKLVQTFEAPSAAPWYLHQSNPGAFPVEAKWVLWIGEGLVHRTLLGLVLWATSDRRLSPRWAGALALLSGTLSVLVIAGVSVRAGWRDRERGATLAGGLVLLGSAATHAVFFGAPRYGLLIWPILCLLLGVSRSAFDIKARRTDDAAVCR